MKTGATDFLSRLARRAVSPTPTIRPRLSSRFEAMAAAVPEPTMAANDEAGQRASIADGLRANPLREDLAAPTAARADLRTTFEAIAKPVPAAASVSPTPAAAPTSLAPILTHVERLTTHTRIEPAPARDAASASPRPAPLAAQAEGAEAHRAFVPSSEQTPRPVVQLQREMLAPLVTPPIPVAATPANASAPGTARAQPTRAAEQAATQSRVTETPPPIEIVIGRIEIHAFDEPVPRVEKRTASPHAPALPLADYLRSRERGGR